MIETIWFFGPKLFEIFKGLLDSANNLDFITQDPSGFIKSSNSFSTNFNSWFLLNFNKQKNSTRKYLNFYQVLLTSNNLIYWFHPIEINQTILFFIPGSITIISQTEFIFIFKFSNINKIK